MDVHHKFHHRIHWWALAETVGPILVLSVLAIWLTLRYVQPAPPRIITIAAGAPGSAYDRAATSYRKFLAKNGITANILTTQGSVQNLKLLTDPHSGVDVALVQSGTKLGADPPDLVSLGSMFYQPLMVFYYAPKPMTRISELAGKRIAVGPEGSGTRYVAQAIMNVNGLSAKNVQLLELDGDAARDALLKREADAIFLTGDSASQATIKQMLHEEGIRLFDFRRAEAYLRRIPYLYKIKVPAGGFDIGEDLPSDNLTLVAPTVELLARPTLHPALTELLVQAATKTHKRPTALQAAGEFPKATSSDYPLSDTADRYYQSGDLSFVYRYVQPFWLASLINRLWLAALPLAVVLVPAVRLAPQLYNWRIDTKIHHRYGQLMALERQSIEGGLSEERRKLLLARLNEIERALIANKIPGSHADQLYELRQHINFVRRNLAGSKTDALHAQALLADES